MAEQAKGLSRAKGGSSALSLLFLYPVVNSFKDLKYK